MKLLNHNKMETDAFEIGYDNGACVQEGNALYHGSNYYNKNFQ